MSTELPGGYSHVWRFNIGDEVTSVFDAKISGKITAMFLEKTALGAYPAYCVTNGAEDFRPVSDTQLVLTSELVKKEAVDHPQHYGGDVPHETWKCLHAWGLENDALLWNSVKYISRAGKKGDILEDLKKAQWYLAKRIQLLENAK